MSTGPITSGGDSTHHTAADSVSQLPIHLASPVPVEPHFVPQPVPEQGTSSPRPKGSLSRTPMLSDLLTKPTSLHLVPHRSTAPAGHCDSSSTVSISQVQPSASPCNANGDVPLVNVPVSIHTGSFVYPIFNGPSSVPDPHRTKQPGINHTRPSSGGFQKDSEKYSMAENYTGGSIVNGPGHSQSGNPVYYQRSETPANQSPSSGTSANSEPSLSTGLASESALHPCVKSLRKTEITPSSSGGGRSPISPGRRHSPVSPTPISAGYQSGSMHHGYHQQYHSIGGPGPQPGWPPPNNAGPIYPHNVMFGGHPMYRPPPPHITNGGYSQHPSSGYGGPTYRPASSPAQNSPGGPVNSASLNSYVHPASMGSPSFPGEHPTNSPYSRPIPHSYGSLHPPVGNRGSSMGAELIEKSGLSGGREGDPAHQRVTVNGPTNANDESRDSMESSLSENKSVEASDMLGPVASESGSMQRLHSHPRQNGNNTDVTNPSTPASALSPDVGVLPPTVGPDGARPRDDSGRSPGHSARDGPRPDTLNGSFDQNQSVAVSSSAATIPHQEYAYPGTAPCSLSPSASYSGNGCASYVVSPSYPQARPFSVGKPASQQQISPYPSSNHLPPTTFPYNSNSTSPSMYPTPMQPGAPGHLQSPAAPSTPRDATSDLVERLLGDCSQLTSQEWAERKSFYEKLVNFLESQRLPITGQPTVSKQSVDMFSLYTAVKSRGGFEEVCKKKDWRQLCLQFGIGQSNSASGQMKKQYAKCLFPFECFFDRNNVDPGPILASLENKKKGAVKSNKNSVALVTERRPDSSSPAIVGGGPAAPPGGPSRSPVHLHAGPYLSQERGYMGTVPSETGPVSGGYIMGNPADRGYGTRIIVPSTAQPSEIVRDPFDERHPLFVSPSNHYSLPNSNLAANPPYAVPSQVGPGSRSHIGTFPTGTLEPYPSNSQPQNQMGPPHPPNHNFTSAVKHQGIVTPHCSISGSHGLGVSSSAVPVTSPGYSAVTVASAAVPQVTSSRTNVAGTCSSTVNDPSVPMPSSTLRQERGPGSHHPSSSSGAGPPAQGFPPYGSYYSKNDGIVHDAPTCMESSSTFPPASYSLDPRYSDSGGVSRPVTVYSHQTAPYMGFGTGNRGSQTGGPTPYDSSLPVFQQHVYPGGGYGPPNIIIHSHGDYPHYPSHYPPVSTAGYGLVPRSYELVNPAKHHRDKTGKFKNGSYSGPSVHSVHPYAGPLAHAGPGQPGGYIVTGSGPVPHPLNPKKEMSALDKIVGPITPQHTLRAGSTEAIKPTRLKRRKMYQKDIGKIDPWRLVMSLKSGLVAEATWALNILNVLLYDDASIQYFGLSHLPGLLEALFEYLLDCLMKIFGKEQFQDQPKPSLEALEYIDRSMDEDCLLEADADLACFDMISGGMDEEHTPETMLHCHAVARHGGQPRSGTPHSGEAASQFGPGSRPNSPIDLKPRKALVNSNAASNGAPKQLETSAAPFLLRDSTSSRTVKLACVGRASDSSTGHDLSTAEDGSGGAHLTGTTDPVKFAPKLPIIAIEQACDKWSTLKREYSEESSKPLHSDSLSLRRKPAEKRAPIAGAERNYGQFSSLVNDFKCNSAVCSKTNLVEQIAKTHLKGSPLRKEGVKTDAQCRHSIRSADKYSPRKRSQTVSGTNDSHSDYLNSGKKLKLSSVNFSNADCPPRSGSTTPNIKLSTDVAKVSSNHFRACSCEGGDAADSAEGVEITEDVWTHSDKPIHLTTSEHLAVVDRAVAVSSAIRGLSFVPGNERPMSQHEGLVWLLGKLLLFEHRHMDRSDLPSMKDCIDRDILLEEGKEGCNDSPSDVKIKLEIRDEHTTNSANTSREANAEAARTGSQCCSMGASGACKAPANCEKWVDLADHAWWWGGLQSLRDDAFTTLSNVSSHLDFSSQESSVGQSVLSSLLHWVACPAPCAQDPILAPSGTLLPNAKAQAAHTGGGIVSEHTPPLRFAMEILTKLSVQEGNVDLMLATPPWPRLEQLLQRLSTFASPSTDNPLREFAIVLLSAFANASELAAAAIARSTQVLHHMLTFLEMADSTMHQVVASKGMTALRENPELMGTSVGMLRRVADALLAMARVPDNRARFARSQHLLLQFTMSHPMDSRAAATIAEVLFELQKETCAALPEQSPNLTDLDKKCYDIDNEAAGFPAVGNSGDLTERVPPACSVPGGPEQSERPAGQPL